MKPYLACCIMAGLLAGASCPARADGHTVGVDLSSAYVWRGVTRNDGPVVRPWLDLSVVDGFGVHVWGNLDLDDYDGRLEEGEFSEFDITLSYVFSAGSFEYGVGYVEYLFPSSMTNTTRAATREVFALTSARLGLGFSTTLQVHYDIDQIEDFHAGLSLRHSHELSKRLRSEASATAGYAGDRMAAGAQSGWHEYTVAARLVCDLAQALSCEVRLAFTDSIDTDVLPRQDTDLHGSVSVGYEF